MIMWPCPNKQFLEVQFQGDSYKVERFSRKWQWLTLAVLACPPIKLIKGWGNKGLNVKQKEAISLVQHKCKSWAPRKPVANSQQELPTQHPLWLEWDSEDCSHNLCGYCTKEQYPGFFWLLYLLISRLFLNALSIDILKLPGGRLEQFL